MIPCGYVIAKSAMHGNHPITTGFRASTTLSVCWFFLWFLLTTGGEGPSYATFVASLHEGVEQALQLYRQNENISTETLTIVEESLQQMKVYVPKLLPSLMIGMILFIVWLTLAVGNKMLQFITGHAPWAAYRLWQLPEKLIWFFIVSAICTLIPAEPIRTIGINLLLVSGLLYFFQGVSILIYLLNKWKLPKLFRAVLYVMIIFQSFGTVLLIGVGVADVWFNFRQINTGESDTQSKSEPLK